MTDYYIGEIRVLAIPNGRAPQDWLLCDGSMVNINQYQTLYSLIGTTYGGNGVTTFGLPDMRGRLPVGQGTGTGLTPRAIGQSYGTEQAQVPAAALPQHSHPFNILNTPATTPAISAGVGFATTASPTVAYLKDGLGTTGGTEISLFNGSVSNVGGGAGHNNIMPCVTMNFIICWQGIYPTRAN
jgi:microcystin-dependent protein